MSNYTVLFILAGLQIFLCCFIWWFLSRRRNPQKDLTMNFSVRDQSSCDRQEEYRPAENSKNLSDAEFKAVLQRVNFQRREVPEKYRYLVTMASKGMESKDLAQVFGISVREAKQLINLSRIVGKPGVDGKAAMENRMG